MNPCGTAVDYQNGYQWIGKIYPFPDRLDQFIKVLFYPTPLNSPYLQWPTIFNVRQWDRREFKGRTPLGTDQEFYRKILGKFRGPAPHAPQGTPDQWLNGFNYSEWITGALGGNRCCEIVEPEGGGAGGGDWFRPDTPLPPLQTLVVAYINWQTQSTGWQEVTSGGTEMLPQPWGASPPQWVWSLTGFVFLPEMGTAVYGAWPPAAGFVTQLEDPAQFYNFFSPNPIPPAWWSEAIVYSVNPFYAVYEMLPGGEYGVQDLRMTIAAYPFIVMEFGGKGGGTFGWKEKFRMEIGGQGGLAVRSWITPIYQLPMAGGGVGGNAWAFDLSGYFVMLRGSKGGGNMPIGAQGTFAISGGGKGGNTWIVRLVPGLLWAQGSKGGGQFGYGILIAGMTGGGTGGGGFNFLPNDAIGMDGGGSGGGGFTFV